jgi:hypothetical protein
MFQPVQPVPAAPPTTGLVATATTPTDGERWESGFAWRPERCPLARGYDPCGDETSFENPPVGAGDTGVHYYRPVAFRVEDECSTRGEADAGRVSRQALAVTSWMVARELQAGALTRANPYETPATGGAATATNAYLAGPDTTVEPGTWEPLAGLGRIEELARDGALGMDPYIHMPVEFVPLVATALYRDGRMLRTFTGAYVVADAGYDGSGLFEAGTAEVQTVTVTGAPTGGTFTLSYEGNTTAAIPFNADAATVQAAINALPTSPGLPVTVTGAAGGPYTVTFQADDGNVDQMTADGSGLTGGTTPAVAVATTTPGVAPTFGAGSWLYASGSVQVRLGGVITDEIVDWDSNRRIFTADRMFAAAVDPCNLHALAITVPATA